MLKLLKGEKGFTLLELLVVIAIIGILATLVFFFIGDYREKARDARRLSDIRQVASSLELYYNDNMQYPGTDDTESWGDASTAGTLVYELQGGGGGKVYMPLVPSDLSSMTYFYYPGNSNQTYVIGVDQLENESNSVVFSSDIDYADITDITVPAGTCNDPEYCLKF